jgi:hypothetical protein
MDFIVDQFPPTKPLTLKRVLSASNPAFNVSINLTTSSMSNCVLSFQKMGETAAYHIQPQGRFSTKFYPLKIPFFKIQTSNKFVR